MRLLVCGGAGFIGSAFVARMLAKHADWEIVCYDKLTYAGNLDNLLDGRRRPALQLRAWRHLRRDRRAAAIDGAVASTRSSTSPPRRTSTAPSTSPSVPAHRHLRRTHTLLEVVRELGIDRVVQVSTDEVYGSIDRGSFCETDRIHPSSPYSASKAGGDLQVLAYPPPSARR